MPLPGSHRDRFPIDDQDGTTLDRKWVEERMMTPFQSH
jgi:hypothetical protein